MPMVHVQHIETLLSLIVVDAAVVGEDLLNVPIIVFANKQDMPVQTMIGRFKSYVTVLVGLPIA